MTEPKYFVDHMGGIKKFWDLPTAINWMFAHLQRNYDSHIREDERFERSGRVRTVSFPKIHGRRIKFSIDGNEVPFPSEEEVKRTITELADTAKRITMQNLIICGDDRHESLAEIVHLKNAKQTALDIKERNESLQGILGGLGKGVTARDATGTIITATRVIPPEEQIRVGNNVFIKKDTVDKAKKSKNNEPVNLSITPEAMDENAKGQYEFCDQFCDYLEQMGLGAMLGENGVKELREFNDQKMKEYDPEYLKKKEQSRETTNEELKKPSRRRFEL